MMNLKRNIMEAYVIFRNNTNVKRLHTPTIAMFNIPINDYLNGKKDACFISWCEGKMP